MPRAEALPRNYSLALLARNCWRHLSEIMAPLRHIAPLTAGELSMATTNLGDLLRLQRFFHKLDAGLPVTISAIGSSVTSDFGGAIARQQQGTTVRLPGGLRRWSARAIPSDVKRGWLFDVFLYINSTWPHPGHKMINCGNPASQIGFYALCTASVVEPTSDLVVIEPLSTAPSALAHNPTPERWQSVFEATLRSVLSLPAKPAAILLDVFSPCLSDSLLCTPSNLSTGTASWNYASLLPSYRASRDDQARQVTTTR